VCVCVCVVCVCGVCVGGVCVCVVCVYMCVCVCVSGVSWSAREGDHSRPSGAEVNA